MYLYPNILNRNLLRFTPPPPLELGCGAPDATGLGFVDVVPNLSSCVSDMILRFDFSKASTHTPRRFGFIHHHTQQIWAFLLKFSNFTPRRFGSVIALSPSSDGSIHPAKSIESFVNVLDSDESTDLHMLFEGIETFSFDTFRAGSLTRVRRGGGVIVRFCCFFLGFFFWFFFFFFFFGVFFFVFFFFFFFSPPPPPQCNSQQSGL